jgi:hypothetical protein
MISTADSDALNAAHINAIRTFPGSGIVPWGSRTLDRSRIENRFIATVRTRDWIAASIGRSLAFASVEDNADPLWTRIRTMTFNFLYSLYLQGALVGAKPEEAFFVRCDSSTTTAADVAAHRVNLLVGLALIRPAEFDVFTLSASTFDPARPDPDPILHWRATPDVLRLAFPTAPGFRYEMESVAAFPTLVWTGIGSATDGDGSWRQVSIPMTGPQEFYRLRIVPGR